MPRPTLVPIAPWLALAAAAIAAGEEPAVRATLARPAPFVEVTPVSEAFRDRLGAAVETIPGGVWRRLERAGWRFQTARFVLDAAPQLRGQRPRGWPEGDSWEQTDAVHLARERLLVVGEQMRNRRGETVPSPRTERVLRHEVGHAYDTAQGGTWRFASSHPRFQAAYAADLAQLPPAEREPLGYYLQTGAAGRQEAFAEAFAELCGGGSSPERAAAFTRGFPRVLGYVRRLLDDER